MGKSQASTSTTTEAATQAVRDALNGVREMTYFESAALASRCGLEISALVRLAEGAGL